MNILINTDKHSPTPPIAISEEGAAKNVENNSAGNSAKAPRLLALGLASSLGITLLMMLTPFVDYIQGALSLQQVRIGSAVSVLLSYILFYNWIQQRHMQAHHASYLPTIPFGSVAADEVLIVYASQTGYAEQLAMQTLTSLQEGSMSARLINIQTITPEVLQQAKKILFIASTTGEGDAPDSAAKFTRNLLHQTLPLSHLHYAVLALGDRHYQAFCAFGHQLDHWLRQQGAHSLFDLVEVDNGDDGALRHWQHHLGMLSGHTDLADWHQAEYESWILSERHLLNPSSHGGAVYQLRLTPLVANLRTNKNLGEQWQAGDIAEILPRRPDINKPLPHREYSIASIPSDGAVELLVRQMAQADGSLGLGSGWLTHFANIGDTIDLRLRVNRSFHPPAEDVPMILIGNGTGIAGLRAHLKQRAEKGVKRNWLIFGERERAHDFFCQHDIAQWQASGILNKLDLAFSRDQEQKFYVQDKLREQADELRNWIAQGAAIYVCGSLAGMAGGVDLALREILGEAELERLRDHGLYRRDVY